MADPTRNPLIANSPVDTAENIRSVELTGTVEMNEISQSGRIRILECLERAAASLMETLHEKAAGHG